MKKLNCNKLSYQEKVSLFGKSMADILEKTGKTGKSKKTLTVSKVDKKNKIITFK